MDEIWQMLKASKIDMQSFKSSFGDCKRTGSSCNDKTVDTCALLLKAVLRYQLRHSLDNK